ncbi:DNA translocase FtsK [Amnibacterium sp.]|uniref:DNA translocase FtsK n=1 Tax=Amnibacterium sp. TaxID=1872496 RepID=UPI00261E1966|nr:DNA translocase FtsK [Amnibacterium sp.]MCU1472161.1 translocase FtsK [Amnibacterium sp.]
MLQLTSDPKRSALLLLAGFVAVAALLFLWWPAGTVLGLVAGGFAVHRIGTGMQRAAESQPWADLHDVTAWLDDREPRPEHQAVAVESASVAPVPDEAEPAAVPELRDEVRSQLTGLKTQLGDDYPDFARAARLVVETQYASAARLQRELQVPYSRARRLLTDLEQQHLVGPATGSLPRQVLMPKDRLPELEAVLAS